MVAEGAVLPPTMREISSSESGKQLSGSNRNYFLVGVGHIKLNQLSYQ